MRVEIENYMQAPAVCSACGSAGILFEIRAGSFLPIVGVCYSCNHAWMVLRTSHVDKMFQRWKNPAMEDLSNAEKP